MDTASPPSTIGICGIGQIGRSLSLLCWRSGYRVLMYDQDPSKLESARHIIQEMDSWMAAEFPEWKPSYGELECAPALALLDRDADLILECIQEDLAEKSALLRRLRGAASRNALFCSCTSGLSISEIGTRSGCAHQLVGTHFWSPPHLMPLVEVIPGSESTEEILQSAMRFCQSIGKRPVRVNRDVPGFIGNRMLHALWREAIAIVERGIASPEDVDLVAKLTIGLRLSVLGPLEHMDLAGLDLVRSIQEYLLPDLADNKLPGERLNGLIAEGRLGVKTGEGFHDWNQRGSKTLIEARDRQIIRELRRLDEKNST